MEKHAKQKWDTIYAATDAAQMQATDILVEFEYLLPTTGSALDIACGLGGNAIFLAQHGLHTHAWDISEQAISKLTQYCEKNSIQLNTNVRDVHENPPSANSFDIICVSNFLERNITNDIISALKPNGLLFYQTFIQEKISEHGPSSLKYLLSENELLKLFSPLHTLIYLELGHVGDTKQGKRNIAQLVAQKR